ncbi:adenosylmethionine decarboxylase [Thiomonas sp.]
MRFLGKQLIAELYGCDERLLSDADAVRVAMLEAASRARCTIVTQAFHHFSPYGVSGAVIVAESHLTIHTWPEYGYAAVDVFTCGDSADPELALAFLKEALGAATISATELRRGAVAASPGSTVTG